MRFPYGIEITENCLDCRRRAGRLFCDLPQGTLERLQTLGVSAACPKGSILFTQGQSPQKVFIVCIGHIKLSMASPTARRFCCGVAEPGTVLGLSSLISGKPHEVDAEALEACHLRVLKASPLLDLLREDDAACLAAVRCLSNDVQRIIGCVRLLGLSHSGIQRLAKLLIQLSAREGTKTRTVVYLSHRELAQMLGMTRETVTRLLALLTDQQIIQRNGPYVLVGNENALRMLSSLS
jgi:CRP/FNR family transcriptional regulator, cyclic AMP receptor protein